MARQSREKWQGWGKQVMGKGKEKVGELTRDEELEAEGHIDQLEGKAQEAKGKLKEKARGLRDKTRR